MHLYENARSVCPSIFIVCLICLLCASHSRRGFGRQVSVPFFKSYNAWVSLYIYSIIFICNAVDENLTKMGLRQDRADVIFNYTDSVGLFLFCNVDIKQKISKFVLSKKKSK